MAIAESTLKQTTCAYCGVGCGIDVKLVENQPMAIEGSPDHPANFGRLCIKGTNLLETTSLDHRLMAPCVNGKTVSWDTAIDEVASKFNHIIEKHGPESVAFYVSGQLLTEDYYVANKLMKGYIGSANIDTNSRLCMSSAVSGHKRAFGEDIVPCSYQDLEQTDLVVFIGSNAAWTHPVLFQRIERAKKINPNLTLIAIDPRKSTTAEQVDMHLAIKPGSDAALFNGLLNYLAEKGALDNEFINKHTNDFSQCLASAENWTVERTANYCQLTKSELIRFYQIFVDAKSTVSFFSQGVNQSSSGTDKCNAIINCHLASGKIGKTGSGPFSITGQPNAMGGREVGGLATSLAAHMDIENASHRNLVQKFWQSPKIAKKRGYKAVELFEQMAEGKIKAVWIMATNPVVSLPNRNLVEQALKHCDFVVVSDCVEHSDTMDFADVKLPATTWSEKNGTVTNSERRISRQRSLVPPPGKARHDWQIICDVAKAMGHDSGFNFKHPAEIFDQHARLTAFENEGTRALDLSGLTGLNQQQYDQLIPVQWPVNEKFPLGCQQPLSGGKFYTKNGKANFVPVIPELPKIVASNDYPFSLTSGRLRDQWHTMTRSGKTNALTEHSKVPEVTLHPETAKSIEVVSGEMVQIFNQHGQAHLPVKISESVKENALFVPIHWSKQYASSANISSLFASIVDPISGQPELKHTTVQLKKIPIEQYALIYSPEVILNLSEKLPDTCHWVRYQGQHTWIYQLKSEFPIADLSQNIKQAFERNISNTSKETNNIEKSNEPIGWLNHQQQEQISLIAMINEQFYGFSFISNQVITLEDAWLNDMLGQKQPTREQISAVLKAKAPKSSGRKICSCFDVYEQEICTAISEEGLTTVDSLGSRLKCGTNCGTCKPELSQLINKHLQESKPILTKQVASL